MNTEILFLTEFKMNPFEIFDDMTLTDFTAYITGMEMRLKERNEKYSNSKQLATQLFMLRNVLNSMQF